MHEDSLFLAALERPTPADRADFLDAACGGDAGLRARVERLLAADSDGGILDTAVAAVAPPLARTLAEGAEFAGRYRLVRRLGTGGMGEVWAADQTEPVRRPVALKFVQPGFDPTALIARFDRERQLLAVMDHPNIARVFDAGVSGGFPYLAMELVDGVPVTAFCDARRMTVRQRLELFLPVCRAVQHAHQKGIIHRDLKPGNVLVAEVDGGPAPKVIDFGIAKGRGAWSSGGTIPTGHGAVLGTPEYMAPEQATGASDVDTRADVYALGVVLYELLTGAPPFRAVGPGPGELLDVLRAVREDDAPAPSARAATASDPSAVAAARSADPRRLRTALRGDLDRVVLKALEKDRGRRYDTVGALAQDVERYLAGEPVAARAVGRGERVVRWARRNPVVTGSVAAVSLLVLAVAVVATAFTVRLGTALAETRSARDRAQTSRHQTRQALDTLTDKAVERLLSRQAQLTAEDREFLNRVVDLHEALARADGDTPDARSEVATARYRVGLIRHRLGEYAAAEESFTAARAELQPMAEAHPDRPAFRRDLARTHAKLCVLLRETARPESAERAGRAAVELFQGLADAHPDQTEFWVELALAQHNLGVVLQTTGQLGPAEEAHRAAVRLLKDRAVKPVDREVLATCHIGLGHLLQKVKKLGPAQESYLAGREVIDRVVGEVPENPDYRHQQANVLNSLAAVYAQTGHQPKAEQAFRHSTDVMRKLAAEYPLRPAYRRQLASTQSNLGNLLSRMERYKESEAEYRSARASYEGLLADGQLLTADRNSLAVVLAGLAIIKWNSDDNKAARTLIDEALGHDRAAVKAEPSHPDYKHALSTHLGILTELLLGVGDHVGATIAAEEVVAFAHEPGLAAWIAAGVFARCAPLAANDGKRAAVERKQLSRAYADRAVVHLRSAVRNRCPYTKRIGDDECFQFLKGRADFDQLLRELDPAGR